MNPFEMVVLIVAIVMGSSVLRARYAAGSRPDDAGTEQLLAEVARLRDRVTVLERIVTDGDHTRALALEREIDALRDGRA